MLRRVIASTLAICLLVGLVALPHTAGAGPAEIAVFVDGTRVQFDVPPLVSNSRTLVPVRRIFEALGAAVTWDGASRTVTAKKAGRQIAIRVDDGQAVVGGSDVDLDVPARLVDGRVLVPLRFVSEALGARVEWDGSQNSIQITLEELDDSGRRQTLLPSCLKCKSA